MLKGAFTVRGITDSSPNRYGRINLWAVMDLLTKSDFEKAVKKAEATYSNLNTTRRTQLRTTLQHFLIALDRSL